MILVLLLVAAAALYILWPQLQTHTTLRIGDGVFKTQVAKTSVEREKGLGGTAQIRDDQAMLFVFETDAKWPMWMKDVSYPIDMVWLNKEKKVVYIVKNVPPESYPYEKFVSKDDARFVLELAAGSVARKTITIGTQATFDENNLEGFKL
jgi:uncharacterized membrane protein (UPF0127 family)